jgi:hypothetical protein
VRVMFESFGKSMEPLFWSILQHIFPEYRSTRVFLWKAAIAK